MLPVSGAFRRRIIRLPKGIETTVEEVYTAILGFKWRFPD